MNIGTGHKGTKKGFTLIELLVVIAIIAILSVVVVLTLNPAEMLRRSRDSNRISDLATIKSAISLYLEDLSISSSTSISMGTAGTCYVEYTGATSPTNIYEFPASASNENATPTAYTSAGNSQCAQWFSTQTATAWTARNSRSVNSTSGWIPVNLSLISTGAPIGQWPVDPANDFGAASPGEQNATNLYFYIPGSNNQYKLAAKMESTQYSYIGPSDLESTDGGSNQFMYEQGSNLAL
jgi:prepilin-type N-terminal cleavage/methylation domain-containing protein